MAIELCECVINRRNGYKGWWASVAPVSNPYDYLMWLGPFNTLKAGRIETEKVLDNLDWVTNKRAYLKIDLEESAKNLWG